jgi:hypothetical protein
MRINKEFLIQEIEGNSKNETFVSENKKITIEVDYTLHLQPTICDDYALIRAGHCNHITIPDWNKWCSANNASHLIL